MLSCRRLLPLFLAILLPAFMVAKVSAEERKTIRLYFPNGESVLAELALSGEERQRGLMFRDGMAPSQGMLFAFEEDATHSFWMKNMRFSIDMIWLDRERRIVYMAKRVPPCRKDPCPFYSPVLPARFVLELAAARSDELGLKPGDRLEFSLPLQK